MTQVFVQNSKNNKSENLTTKTISNNAIHGSPKNKSKSNYGKKSNATRISAGILLVIASASIVGWAVQKSADRQSVLVIDRSIARGAQFDPSDFRETELSRNSSLNIVDVSEEPNVLGKYASVSLLPGSVLVNGDITTSPTSLNGQVIVGIDLRLGQEPVEGLSAGEDVMVVFSPPPGASPENVNMQTQSNLSLVSPQSNYPSNLSQGSGSADLLTPGQVLFTPALVVNVVPPPPNSSTNITDTVSLALPTNVGPTISTLASAGQLSLVLIPRG